MRRLRWIVYAPAALIAFFAAPAAAQDFIAWTCVSDTQWQMQQPLADYQSGLYPTWSDCEAWRNGAPADGWQWSYGASVSSSTVADTSTVPPSTTSSLPATTSTSTTEPPATTAETTTTTTQVAPTTQPIPQTSTWPQPTEPASTTTEAAATTVAPTTVAPTTPPSPTTSRPSEASTSLVQPSEASTPTQTTPTTFFSPEASGSVSPEAMPTPAADASEEEKQAFEEQVNIFDGSHEDYVPLGSTITVAERRTIVAASTILMTLPTPTASRRRT